MEPTYHLRRLPQAGGVAVSVWGVSMVRDEMDILPYTLPRMAAQLDGIVIADNMSEDGTFEYIQNFAFSHLNIIIRADDDPAYMQSQKMTSLAKIAAEHDADWVVPFDADEVWVSSQGPLNAVLVGVEEAVVAATLYDHVVSGTDDVFIEDPIKRIGWRRAENLSLPKVACRTLPGLVIEQGNHGARYPGQTRTTWRDIVVHHYPYRSVAQMARKAHNGAEAYAAAGDRLPATAGQHWRDYGRFLEQDGIEAIREIFETWFYADNPMEGDYVWDPPDKG